MNEKKKTLDFLNPKSFNFYLAPLKIPYEDTTLIETILLRKPKTKFSTPAAFYSTPSYLGLPPWHVVAHNPPGVLSDIWNKVRDVWNKLWEFWDSMLGWNVRRWWDKQFEALWFAYKQTHDFLRDPLTKLREAAERARDVVWTWIRDRTNWVRDRVNDARNWLKDRTWEFTAFLRDRLNYLRDWMSDQWTYWSAFLKGAFTLDVDELKTKILTPIGGFWHTFTDAIKNSLNTLWEKIGGGLNLVWEWLKGITINLTNLLTGSWLPAVWNTAKGAFGWIVDIFKGSWDELMGFRGQLAHASHERGPEIVTTGLRFLGTGAMFLAAMTAMSHIIKRISSETMGWLKAILYDMSGYKYVTGAIMGGLVLVAFKQPLKYYYNRIFRPYLPPFADILEMYDRGIIEPFEFEDHLASHGIAGKWFEPYRRFASRPMTPTLIARMPTYDLTTPADLATEIRFYGLNPEHSKGMIETFWWRGKEPYLSRLLTAQMFCLRRGFATVGELMSTWDWLRGKRATFSSGGAREIYPITHSNIAVPSTADIFSKIGEWETKRLSIGGQVDSIEASYRFDLITESEARGDLARVIKIPEMIDAVINPIKYRKSKAKEPEAGKDPRKAVRTRLIINYKEGFITTATFRGELEKAKAITTIPELFLMQAEWSAYYDRTSEMVRLWSDQYKKDLMTEDELRGKLREFIPDERKRELVIDLAKVTKYRKPEPEVGVDPRKALKGELTRNFKDGFITKETFKKELEKATAIIDLPTLYLLEASWSAYYEKIKDGISLRSDKFRRDIITKEEFETWLTANVPQESVRTTIIEKVETAKYKEEEPEIGRDPRASIRSALTASFKEGYINQATFLAELEKAKKIVTIPLLYLMEAEQRKFYDETYEEIGVWRKALEKAVVTEDAFRTHLREMGIDLDKIARFMTLDTLKKLKKA